MKTWRKLILGMVYLFSMTFIAWYSLRTGHVIDLGMGSFAAGIATGVGSIVWGYNKEHEAEAKVAIETAKAS